MAIGDVYQIRLNGTYGVGNWSNVWYYQQRSGGASDANAEDLWDEFESTVLPPLSLLQSTTILYSLLEVVNMRVTSDFYATVTTSATGGTVAGSSLAPTVAFQYRQARPAPGTRYGYKRFIGVPESQADGALWSPSSVAAYGLANAMEFELEGDLGSWVPVIVGSPRIYGVNPPVRYDARDWTPRQYLSTQVTRQIYNPNPLPLDP